MEKDGKWGYIDRKGNTVIPFRYALAGEFHKGIARTALVAGPLDPR
ncbi:MAG: WG repeat-containing protein, partial [Phycisphaerae bacterium]